MTPPVAMHAPAPRSRSDRRPRTPGRFKGLLVRHLIELLVAGVVACCAAEAASSFPLKVSENRRYLVDAGGAPFLVVGDTAWSLIAQLTEPEIATYLDDRRRRGFNAIIVNLVEAKFATQAPATLDGLPPFPAPGDFAQPNPAYFDLARRVVEAAGRRGVSVWLFPAYLGWQGGDEGLFQRIKQAGPTALRAYGRYVGADVATSVGPGRFA